MSAHAIFTGEATQLLQVINTVKAEINNLRKTSTDIKIGGGAASAADLGRVLTGVKNLERAVESLNKKSAQPTNQFKKLQDDLNKGAKEATKTAGQEAKKREKIAADEAAAEARFYKELEAEYARQEREKTATSKREAAERVRTQKQAAAEEARAAKAAAQAAREAIKEQLFYTRLAAQERKQVEREAAKAAADTAREQVKAARLAAAEQSRAAKESAAAQKQAAREVEQEQKRIDRERAAAVKSAVARDAQSAGVRTGDFGSFKNRLLPVPDVGIDPANGQKRLAAATREAGNAANQATSAFARFRATILAFATGYIVIQGLIGLMGALKNALIDFNATQQQLLVGFTTQLNGNRAAAEALYKQLQDFNDLSPFRELEIAPVAQKLLAAQVPAKELMNAMRGIGEQTAALGGDANKFSHVGTALAQIWLKPRLQLEELTTQLIEHGVPAFSLLAKAYKTNEGQIQAWITKGMIPGKEAARALWNQMERNNFGATAKQAQTFTGALSTLADRMNRKLGEAFKDSFLQLNQWLNILVRLSADKRVQEWVGSIAHRFQMGFSIIRTVVTESVRYVIENIKRLGQAFEILASVGQKSFNFIFAMFKDFAINTAKIADFIYNMSPQGAANKILGGGTRAGDTTTEFFKNLEAGAGQAAGALGDLKKAWDVIKIPGIEKGWDRILANARRGNTAGGSMPDLFTPSLGPPKSGADTAAKKAAAAARKLEIDQLQDAEKRYGMLAKAIEDSAQRQMKALTGLRDTLRDVFSSMQQDLIQLGIINDPLGPLVKRFEQLLSLGQRMKNLASNAQSGAEYFRSLAGGAASRRDSLQGGDGSNPQYNVNGAKVVNDWSNATLKKMADSFASGAPYRSCAFVASRMAEAVGANISKTASAGQLRRNAIAAGWQRVASDDIQRGDLVFNRSNHRGGSGWHVKTGIGDNMVLNSNHRQQTIYRDMGKRAYEVYRSPNRAGTNSVGGSGVGYGKAGTTNFNGNLDASIDLDGTLTKIRAVPQAWGEAVANTEKTSTRFMMQSKMATAEFQNYVMAISDALQVPSDTIVRLFRAMANQVDDFKMRVQAAREAQDWLRNIRKDTAGIGRENDPRWALEQEFKPGGKFANVNPTGQDSMRTALERNISKKHAVLARENEQLERQRLIELEIFDLAEATRLEEEKRVKIMADAEVFAAAASSRYDAENAIFNAELAQMEKEQQDRRQMAIAVLEQQKESRDAMAALENFDLANITKEFEESEQQTARFNDALEETQTRMMLLRIPKRIDREMERLKLQWLKDKFTDAQIDQLMNVARQEYALTEMVNNMQQAADNMTGIFTNAFEEMYQAQGSILDKMQTGISSVFGNIAKMVRDMSFQLLSNLAVNALMNGTGLGKMLGGLTGAVNNSTPTIVGINGPIPNIGQTAMAGADALYNPILPGQNMMDSRGGKYGDVNIANISLPNVTRPDQFVPELRDTVSRRTASQRAFDSLSIGRESR